MENLRGKMKTPTLRKKVDQYESFLHKINMCCISGNNDGIRELVENADIWSYAHRVGNGELSDKKQQQAINNAFWKLCDTPKTDKDSEERQKFWSEAKDRILKQKGKVLK
jgi:hypothetical protein